jgi:hypothetical protein
MAGDVPHPTMKGQFLRHTLPSMAGPNGVGGKRVSMDNLIASIVSASSKAMMIFGSPGVAYAGSAFSFQPIIFGGSGSKSFTLSGVLPSGWSFSSSTGLLSTSSAIVGMFTGLAITATDAAGVSATLPVTLIVAATIEAASYFNRMTTKPAAGVVSALDTMISTLRTSTAWAKLDNLYFLAQDTYQAALLNILGAHPLRVAGSPTFSARGGVAGAANASLTNGVVLSEGTLANYSLNSGHVGVFVGAASASTSPIAGTGATFTTQLLARSAGGNAGGKINGGTTMSAAVGTRGGHTVASRTGAAASALYRNGGAALATTTSAPTAVPVSPLYVLRDDTAYATDTVAAFHSGAGLTQAENQIVYDALNTAITAITALGPAPAANANDFDVVVYGGTLSGLMAAQRAANRGARVAIVEPSAELGGVGHHGLTYFDLGLRGSYLLANNGTDRFFKAINAAYGQAAPLTAAQKAEPKVYDQVFATTLAQTRATTFLSSPLVTTADVQKAGSAITGIKTASGWITGRQFIDCSYEMDLAALAGAPYQVGRESVSTYGEPAAGFSAKRVANGGFNYGVDGVTPNSGYPVRPRPATADGAGDGLIQPYSFRFPITTAADRLPFPVPPGGYIASKMDQFVAVLTSKNVQQFTSVIYVGGDTALQNNKFCINGSQANIIPSLELPGVQAGYPDGTPAQRQAVIDELRTWTLHVLYCLQNDPRISASLRTSAAAYGLCNDEFVNNPIKGFPNLPYIRESRRLKGAYVMTQLDVLRADNANNTSGGARNNVKANRIGQWNYALDSHAMEIYPDGTNNIVVTGNVDPKYSEVDTYDVPFTALHTDPAGAGHVANLTVPQSYSASSVAWMSGRLEPNFAQLAEAAGEAAMIAAEDGVDISAVSYTKLSRRLGSPVNTALPVITDTGGGTYSVSNGTWNFSPTKYDFQWKLNGATVTTGNGAATYTRDPADAGKTLTCAVIATNISSAAQAVSTGLMVAA